MAERNEKYGDKYSDRSSGGDRDSYGGGGYGDDSKDGDRGGRRSFHRKKVCRFCADNEIIMDYKDAKMMASFMMERGKIVPRRISGNCALHQRKLTTALKRARNLALVGYISSGQEYHREPRGDYRDRSEHRSEYRSDRSEHRSDRS